MANRECNLTKRIRLADGTTRFCPVVLSQNGRIKPDWVIVDGREERHSEGNYYLDWYEGSKRIRLSVGKNVDPPRQASSRSLHPLHDLSEAHGLALLNQTCWAAIKIRTGTDRIPELTWSKLHRAEAVS